MSIWIGFCDRINFDPVIQITYVNTTQQVADIPTKGSLTGNRCTPLTHPVNIPTHTPCTQHNLSVSYAVVNPLSSSMGKRAGESFAASACAKQKPVHCTAMMAWRIIDKNADMDYHAAHPPGYKAGGDSKREELRQQDLHHHDGDWSIIKLRATRKRLEQLDAPCDVEHW